MEKYAVLEDKGFTDDENVPCDLGLLGGTGFSDDGSVTGVSEALVKGMTDDVPLNKSVAVEK
eukprot:5896955-Prorocentrum_lima.AAC.1